jgi:HEAT repeat protein
VAFESLPSRTTGNSSSGNLLSIVGVYDCNGVSMFDNYAFSNHQAEWRLFLHLWICALAVHCYSQAPPTFAEVLRRHNVELNEDALVRALHSPDKEVRGLAAAELAELKLTSALPEIVRAAKNENDAQTQVNMASAATWLGSDEGLQILTSICKNSTVPAFVRVRAAQSVFDKQDHSCFPSLVEMMRPIAETDTRIYALELASQIKNKTQQEARIVLTSAVDALQDQDIRMRLQACEALRWLKDPQAVQPLRKAIDLEREEAVGQQMKSTLNYLENEQRLH